MSDPLDTLRLPTVPIAPRPEFAAMLRARLQGRADPPTAPPPTVRYFVDDLDTAVNFYCEVLGFEPELRASPTFAMLYLGELRLLLSVPGDPHKLPDGTIPQPGGWNRISLRVTDLPGIVAALHRQGARLRTEIVSGPAVDTVLLQDPAGNLVELFQPRAGYHER
jgi:catechol 2,3-dioxygenase-like lactoylglutathione lyase family enzyme